MEPRQITILGQTKFRGSSRKFGIYLDDRRRHVYVIGKTGVGKTTFLENMVAQDIVNGHGVCLIDPHGDAVENLLDMVPPSRINDVVYFDPSDVKHPVAFNVLEAQDPEYKYLIASGLVSSLKKIWADSWGPRLEYILRNTILALLDYPGSTILGILRMLSDKGFRKKVVDKIQDPVVKSFWVDEFAQYNERFRSEAVSPIQNKVGQLLSSAIIRNIMAQSKSTIDMEDIINNRKILLVNVSKGKIGEDNSALLGAMMINRLQLAAMNRAKIPEAERQDFFLYVDEFQNFATESFADILSEARKYRLNLTMAHQYVAQMEEEVRDAVFGNIGTLVAFRVGATDAELLELEFAPVFTQADLVNLDKYNAYIKLMIDGISSRPFSMETLQPVTENYGKGETVRQVSRERYGRDRSIIEEKIRRWSGVDKEKDEDIAEPTKENKLPWGRDDRIKKPAQKATDSMVGGASRTRTAPVKEVPVAEALAARDKKLSPTDRPNPEHTSTVQRPPLAKELVDVTITIPKEKQITDLTALLSSPPEGKRRPSSNPAIPARTMYDVTCSKCGNAAQVPFKPDPDRPVLCKECLAKARAAKQVAQTQPPVTPPTRAFAGQKPPAL